jgi:hypothetical protein
MAAEESAVQVARRDADIPGIDWRPSFQEPKATSDQPTSRAVSPDSPMASEAEPETSVVQLSAVLLIILGGMATTFVLGAIIVVLVAGG